MNDGFISGLDEIYFDRKRVGYIDEGGLTPSGEAAQTTKIRAAQLNNAVVKVLFTTPSSLGFKFNLIQLLGAQFKDIFGGTVDAGGSYSAPAAERAVEGKCLIVCSSGHRIVIPRAVLAGSFGGAISSSQTLQIACTIDILPSGGDAAPYRVLAPDDETALSDYLPPVIPPEE
jgi:hypothetical protein